MKSIQIIKTTIGLMLVILSITSCTEYDNPPLVFEEQSVDVDSTIHKKVMLINIEGAVGEEVRKILPETIKKLVDNGKYSWTGLSELHSNDATTWASLMTGVTTNKHQIVDDTFIPSTSLNDTQAVIPFFPTIFYEINDVKPELETLTITAWDPLYEQLFVHADKRIDVETDIQVKDSVINRLQTSNPDFTLVSFRDVLNAGVTSGFSADNPEYVEALNTVDGYIGTLLETIKQRETYDKEDWLIIVTSNHGGEGTSYGGTSEAERNIFSIFYHPKYQSLELKGKTLYTPRFNSQIVGYVPDPDGKYNIGEEDMTVEFQMRVNPNTDGTYSFGNWNKVLGKSKWGIYRQGNNMKIYMTRDTGGGAIEEAVYDAFNDGLWHSMTVVMITDTEKPSRTVKLYYDGGLIRTVEKTDFTGPITDTADLVFGGSSVDFNIAEVRIWNKALSDYNIAENACLLEVEPSHPEYENLIGYWPSQDGDAVLDNVIDDYPDVTISGTPEFSVSANSLPCDLGADNVNIENISIVPQIYYWLGIDIDLQWSLDAQAFLSRFELELE